MYAPEEELVAIVDDQNQVCGAVTRREMRARGLPHRASYVFVFDHAGQLYVQHRTTTKDVYPGYWDLAAGGVVLAGESYDQSAVRELEEELGVRGVELEPWFEFYFEDGSGRIWGSAYGCRYEGPLTPQAEEVQSVERMTTAEILEGRSGRRFTPDTLFALRKRYAATV